MTWDAAIIGGGPAGCAAAITLARQGYWVVLCESGTYPHHKVCGEIISPEGGLMLDELGVTLDTVPIIDIRIAAPDGSAWGGAFPQAARGISRSAMDEALAARARAAGVDVLEGATVTNVCGSLDDGFSLDVRSGRGVSRLSARTVIGAHGKRSRLDRSLRRAFMEQPQPFVGLKAHFQGPPLPNRIDLYGFPGGYCGMSEIEGGLANVCLLVRQPVFERAGGGRIEPFVAWMGRQNPVLGDWLASAERASERWLSIAQVPFARKESMVCDVLMAGDAAALVAPLAGDGIAMALYGGRLAADTCAAFLDGRRSAEQVRREYPRAWRREFGARHRLAGLLQPLMLRPRLLGPGLRLMDAVPPLGRYLIAHTRDLRHVRQAAAVPPSPDSFAPGAVRSGSG